jgi:hypothetical protein
LKSVDLPTFGRPTSATNFRAPGADTYTLFAGRFATPYSFTLL